ncbi:DUF2164 domain-containing protein [Aliiglaciecola sp. CAU 1673]|uniref:DUF2164 domain-containing protein n=1 Tax=Aliiglaciecola sp. CAU 1673 TaxID=3032595 RepID=UPI0023DCE15A|nr:DUF2164 domain-containing protein [Aliiglaciecola sp. CAU 1673]MDF2179375.1 DUF2164 domain-containing protein [Aliiglaciecola sp. CAU 1673]
MSSVDFPKEVRDHLCTKLRCYLMEELDVELGQFDAEFLLDFIGKEFGAYFYNQGLHDAQAMLQGRLESIQEAIGDIEKPTAF